METNAIQHRIDRVNHLLDRLDSIPLELDAIHEELFYDNLSRQQFTELVTKRNNLLAEKDNKERELKRVYKIINEELDKEEEEF